MKATSISLWLLRLGLAGIYLFAAVPKIADPWSFSRSIWNYHLLPSTAIPLVALWLPILEGLAALAVLSGILYRGGVSLLSALSVLFAGSIASAMVRGLDIECGCFGKAASSSAALPHLALNLAIIIAGILLLIAHGRSTRASRPLR